MLSRVGIRNAVLAGAIVVGSLGADSAHASFESTVDLATETVTLTGDDAAETLVLGDNGAVLTHNLTDPGFESNTDFDDTAAGEQSVLANGTYRIVVTSGGGDDRVTVSTSGVEEVEADFGSGSDSYTGSTAGSGTPDQLTGGPGDDIITGGRGSDVVLGGDGDDTVLWNDGDGSDDVDGQGGEADAAQVNGSPAAGDSFVIAPDGSRLSVDRTNLAPVSLSLGSTTERLELQAHGGNDSVVASSGTAALGILLVLAGGGGDDTLQGGDAADHLLGDQGDDSLTGGGGDDELRGGPNADSVSGGDGDDTVAWNDGDGSDVVAGDSGFDVLTVDGGSAADALSLAPGASGALLSRSNVDPFQIGFGTEAVHVDMLGGDDSLTVTEGTASLVSVDGGSGADAIVGASGHDDLRGGIGPDNIDGGGGSDVIDGDDGDDTISSRDGVADLVRCGAGNDRATLDGTSTDPATDCETTERPAVPAPPSSPPPPSNGQAGPRETQPGAAALRVRTRRSRIRRRRVKVRVECPALARTCRGSLFLYRTVRIGPVNVAVALGNGRFVVEPGVRRTVKVKLVRQMRFIARGRKKVPGFLKTRTAAGGGAFIETLSRFRSITPKRWRRR